MKTKEHTCRTCAFNQIGVLYEIRPCYYCRPRSEDKDFWIPVPEEKSDAGLSEAEN